MILVQAQYHLAAAKSWINEISEDSSVYSSVKFVDASGDETATVEDARHQGV